MRISDWSSDVCSSDLAIGKPRCPALLLRLALRFSEAEKSPIGRVTPMASEAVCRDDCRVSYALGSTGWRALAVAAKSPSFGRSEEHTSELQSLMRISYAVFCLKKKKATSIITNNACIPDNSNK